jgi:hypothetical protein
MVGIVATAAAASAVVHTGKTLRCMMKPQIRPGMISKTNTLLSAHFPGSFLNEP